MVVFDEEDGINSESMCEDDYLKLLKEQYDQDIGAMAANNPNINNKFANKSGGKSKKP